MTLEEHVKNFQIRRKKREVTTIKKKAPREYVKKMALREYAKNPQIM
jgi:hypothetical protein